MCLGWEFFTLLREYDPEVNATATDTDKIANENMFCTLDLVEQLYESLGSEAEPLGAAKAIASPFNFGATNIKDETYDKAKNGLPSTVGGFGYAVGEANVALRDDGTTKHLLLSAGSKEATGWTPGRHKLVMQVSFDTETGDLVLNFTQYSKAPAGGGSNADEVVAMRSYIKGNAKTHYFEVQTASANTGSGPGYWNWSSVQGAGYSKGAGKSFLVYYRGTNATKDPNGVVGPGTAGGYFCIPGDTTKASFGAGIYAKPTGYAALEIPGACADYKAAVEGMTKWEIANVQAADNATPIDPTTNDYPVKSDSALFTGTGEQHLGLAF